MAGATFAVGRVGEGTESGDGDGMGDIRAIGELCGRCWGGVCCCGMNGTGRAKRGELCDHDPYRGRRHWERVRDGTEEGERRTDQAMRPRGRAQEGRRAAYESYRECWSREFDEEDNEEENEEDDEDEDEDEDDEDVVVCG